MSDEVADFPDIEIPKLDSNYICLADILAEFFHKKDENCYLQMFLKNVNTLKKKKGDQICYRYDDLEISSNDFWLRID